MEKVNNNKNNNNERIKIDKKGLKKPFKMVPQSIYELYFWLIGNISIDNTISPHTNIIVATSLSKFSTKHPPCILSHTVS